jgi:hypothetical protein
MRADVALCAHLQEPVPPLRIEPDEILLYDEGPVEGIVRCRRCAAPGWIELIDQGHDRAIRVFALAGLRAADVAVYLRNIQKGSCDLARRGAEAEALAASAGPFERLVAWSVPEARPLAAATLPEAPALPGGAWRERLRAAAMDDTWFERLGLEKRARA